MIDKRRESIDESPERYFPLSDSKVRSGSQQCSNPDAAIDAIAQAVTAARPRH